MLDLVIAFHDHEIHFGREDIEFAFVVVGFESFVELGAVFDEETFNLLKIPASFVEIPGFVGGEISALLRN
jgi:hypothetical protein